jgi:hypothetical protein
LAAGFQRKAQPKKSLNSFSSARSTMPRMSTCVMCPA